MLTSSAISGRYRLVYRNPDGTIGWRVPIRNGTTIQGVNWMLDNAFGGISQTPAVYAGLIASTGFVGVANTDTHASHPGWSELASVTPLVRATWSPQAAGAGAMGTLVPAHITFVGAGFIRGVFLSSVATLGSVSSAGILYNTAVTVSPLAYADGGTLDIDFTPRLRA